MSVARPLLVLAVLVLAAACTGDDVAPTTSSTTTTIGVEITSTNEPVVTVAEGVDGEVAERLGERLDALQSAAELIRGLAFLDPLPVAILDPAGFTARWEAMIDAALDPSALAADTRLYRLLGLLGPGDDLRALLRRTAATTDTVFYDPAAGELVLDGSTADPGPPGDSMLVRELVRALVDDYHRVAARSAELIAARRLDEAEALATLAEADATYFQLVYVQELPEEQRLVVAEAAPAKPAAILPDFLATELAVPGEEGIEFVAALVADGGLAALDGAYEDAALTTELILHPVRYLAGETPREVAPLDVTLPRYQVSDAGSLGEVRLRGVLSSALPPGMLTQTVDGWGGDAYALLTSVDDVAFAYAFRGDREDDAIEVAQAFLDHATNVMGLAPPLAAGGGVEFIGRADAATAEEREEAGPYVFVDRSGAGLVVAVSSDPAAGRALREQLEIP